MNATGYRCVSCASFFKFKENLYICPSCGSNLNIEYNYSLIRKSWNRRALMGSKDFSIFRYEPLYPVTSRISFPGVGWTPLYRADKLALRAGVRELYVKDESRNPGGSLKDRASAIAILRAADIGAKVLTGASTGNAGVSTACLATVSALPVVIFVPREVPVAKLTELLIFGARVVSVNGNYDQAFDMCIEASRRYGWYNRSTGYNPFTREGKKSVAFEICEQLNWELPDVVVVPVGDGNILSGVWKGFKEFAELGFVRGLPRLLAVQAEKSNAIQRAFSSNSEIDTVSGKTIADSISVSFPRDGQAALAALRESGGAAVTVSDTEILHSIPSIARSTGVFVEPAAAATLAGLKVALQQKLVDRNEKVVLILTGSGLKDIENARKVSGEPIQIENDPGELERIKP